MDRPNRPTLPRLGDEQNPATIGELRAGRVICAGLAVVGLVLTGWHWIGGGALWLGLILGALTLVAAVGALSLHGQLHGWDAPEGDAPPSGRHAAAGDA